MGHFFESVASLMSDLVRSTIENSIEDMLDILEEYSEGNVYEGTYNIFAGLALPEKIHPLRIFLVS